nr:MAG TPA: hypothetical protein [Caudoviricetes sp.]
MYSPHLHLHLYRIRHPDCLLPSVTSSITFKSPNSVLNNGIKSFLCSILISSFSTIKVDFYLLYYRLYLKNRTKALFKR